LPVVDPVDLVRQHCNHFIGELELFLELLFGLGFVSDEISNLFVFVPGLLEILHTGLHVVAQHLGKSLGNVELGVD
jgi:hypothetical protein